MDAKQSKSIKKVSRRQEQAAAESIGGQTQAASGATKFGGADVRVMGKYRVECKFTGKSEYLLKLTELEKLRKQAISALEYPIFQFCMKSHLGKLENPFAVIPWDGGDEEYDNNWIIHAKQAQITRAFLDSIRSGNRMKLTFITKDTVRSFRVLPWDDLLEKLKSQEANA
jgi:hypothetical protein